MFRQKKPMKVHFGNAAIQLSRLRAISFRFFVVTTALLYAHDLAATKVYNFFLPTDEVLAIMVLGAYTLLFLLFFWYVYLRYLFQYIAKRSFWELAWIASIKKRFPKTYLLATRVIFLAIINIFFLFRPWFNLFSDVTIIITSPLKLVSAWNQHEREIVKQGERWYPYYFQTFLGKPSWLNSASRDILEFPKWEAEAFTRVARYDVFITRASNQNKIPDWVLPGVILAESGGDFARLPHSEHNGTGGSELGLTQAQNVFCQLNGFMVIGRRHSYMDQNAVYNTYLDYQRSRVLVGICGVSLWGPLDIVRYYIITSIDSRLSSKIFYFTARILKKYYKKTDSKLQEETRWLAAIAKWHTGKTGPKYRKKVKKYQTLGIRYIQWRDEILKKREKNDS